MSILDLHRRPVVKFNAEDPKHRMWVASFVQTGSWKGCPVQFIVQSATGEISSLNPTAAMASQLAAFYLRQELNRPPRKSYYKRKTDARRQLQPAGQ